MHLPRAGAFFCSVRRREVVAVPRNLKALVQRLWIDTARHYPVVMRRESEVHGQ